MICARDRQRIDADVRQRGVGAAAAHHDLELVVGREDGAHPHGEGALGEAREVVQSVNPLDRKALEQAVGDHDAAAALVLLGRLEDEADDAVEVAGGGQVAGGAEEHRGVAVVAAGVHGAVARRAVGQVGALLDRQRVHVGAQPDGAVRAAAAQGAHDPGLGQAAVDLDAERLEALGHQRRGAHLLEGDLGVAVEVVTPGHQLVVHGSVEIGHDGCALLHGRRTPDAPSSAPM